MNPPAMLIGRKSGEAGYELWKFTKSVIFAKIKK
jgi:hypothetical protein